MKTETVKETLHEKITTLGNRGNFTLGNVVDETLLATENVPWDVLDLKKAMRKALLQEAKQICSSPISMKGDEFKDAAFSEDERRVLEGLPYAICVSPKAGPNAQWCLAYRATVNDWRNTLELRQRVASYVQRSTEQVEDLLWLLNTKEVDSLAELSERASA